MSEENKSNDDKTEEASPERREEYREKGQIAVSREITSVVVLGMSVLFLSFFYPYFLQSLERLFVTHFERAATFRISTDNVLEYANQTWYQVLYIVIPLFIVSAVGATLATFLQTRMNWSWKKLKPDFKRMDPLKGVARMANLQALFELSKGLCKMSAVGVVAYLILLSEWQIVPGLLNIPVSSAWAHWGNITQMLFWSVSGLLVFVGILDYFYNYMQLEKQMRMTKQEVKEEFKRKEVDPHLKAKMKRVAREIAMQKVVDGTKVATVIITNPTHYAVAIKYELGMRAPLVVAKGIDHLALAMKETAKEHNIPIVENKPLARTLYKLVEMGHEIPESLYKAVSEVIRYIFQIKGIKVNTSQQQEAVN